MFYPVDSLKRGGRFYLCWVADSWPLRFAAITHRQLWSQDIRKLCDDLMEVLTNESGRPVNRFSLRLSSQLMRGLVRLYERKVTVFLGDMCMIHANVFKHANKKFLVHEMASHVHRPHPQLPRVQEVVPEPPVNAQTVQEMLQNSGNIVYNIQDITLKETAIPDFQLPKNDGFGEEHPDQALQLLGDRTVEMMLLQPDTSTAHSGLELPLDKSAERSHDKSRLLHAPEPQMQRISEHDVTLFRKSTAEGLQPPEDIEKDMLAVPDIPPLAPALEPAPEPAPEPEKQFVQPMEIQEALVQEPPKDQPEPQKEREPEKELEIELEELEEGQVVGRKRRGRPRLIIDKRIKLSGAFLRARIDNPNVELRCEDSSDDIADVRVPWEHLSRRPASAGFKIRSNMGSPLVRLYQTRLLSGRLPYEEREAQKAQPQPISRQTRASLEKIVEEEEPPEPIEQPMADRGVTAMAGISVTAPSDVLGALSVTAAPDASTLNVMAGDVTMALDTTALREQRPSVEPMELEIYDLPTQKLQTLKRSSEYEVSAKRPRLSGYVCFKDHSQQLQKEIPGPIHQEIDKENIPPEREQSQGHSQRNVSTLLQEAGLADLHPRPENIEMQTVPEPQIATETRRKEPSESSETPLGSLDRTKVSLGDSAKTTDSQRFIRNQWGIEGTMTKILNGIKAGLCPVTVENLIEKGPVISGYRSIIAARCFTSILKLKQHSFIKIIKNPDTLEISDITLGPMFDGIE